jgi:hypothetical protein
MTIKDVLKDGLNDIIDKAGAKIRVNYYTQSIGSVYDDDSVLTQSGTSLWTSGVILPLSNQAGTYESLLVEQGKLRTDDCKLYTKGNISITGSEFRTTIMIGSPGEVYSILDPGIISPQVEGERIYKKVFLRLLQNGSLIGQ